MKASSTIEQQNCKGHKKRERLLVSIMNIYFLKSQQKKTYLLIQFSHNKGNLTKNSIYIVLYCFIRKMKNVLKFSLKYIFFWFSCSFTFSNYLLAMFPLAKASVLTQ